jgi:hypothetical protein
MGNLKSAQILPNQLVCSKVDTKPIILVFKFFNLEIKNIYNCKNTQVNYDIVK